MRSTDGSPAPRSMRVGNTSANSLAPVFAAMRPSTISASARRARPPSRKAFLPGPCSAWATAATTASSAAGGAGLGGTACGTPPSPQETSAGRMSVATLPGGPMHWVMASAASRPSAAVLWDVRTQGDTLRATVSMSDCNCASYFTCCVAWSPTMLSTGTRPLRALCRLARPLPSPQPRCRRVAAGLSAMRA